MEFDTLLGQLRQVYAEDRRALTDEIQRLRNELAECVQECFLVSFACSLCHTLITRRAHRQNRELSARLDGSTDSRHVNGSVEIVEENLFPDRVAPLAAAATKLGPSVSPWDAEESAPKRRKVAAAEDARPAPPGRGFVKPWKPTADTALPPAAPDYGSSLLVIDDGEDDALSVPTHGEAGTATSTVAQTSKYVTSVRRKEDREKLKGQACEECRHVRGC